MIAAVAMGVPDNICIVMMSAVGDAVHVLPVINALKRENPRTRITWVLQPGPAALVRGHRSVDEIIIFDRARGLAAFTDVGRELTKRQFDLVINLQVYFKAGIVTASTRAPVKLGFDRGRARDLNWLFTNRKIPPNPVQHVQDQYFEFLTALGVSPEPVVPTRGRSLDHIGFEVRNLEEFCKKLEAQGIKLDRPYTPVPALGIAIAFITDPLGTYIELTEGLNKVS